MSDLITYSNMIPAFAPSLCLSIVSLQPVGTMTIVIANEKKNVCLISLPAHPGLPHPLPETLFDKASRALQELYKTDLDNDTLIFSDSQKLASIKWLATSIMHALQKVYERNTGIFPVQILKEEEDGSTIIGTDSVALCSSFGADKPSNLTLSIQPREAQAHWEKKRPWLSRSNSQGVMARSTLFPDHVLHLRADDDAWLARLSWGKPFLDLNLGATSLYCPRWMSTRMAEHLERGDMRSAEGFSSKEDLEYFKDHVLHKLFNVAQEAMEAAHKRNSDNNGEDRSPDSLSDQFALPYVYVWPENQGSDLGTAL